MDERVMQFRVGVMFLATLLITAILLVMFGKLPDLIGGKYPIYVQFDYAAGVTKGTPVRISGILIGRVQNVQLTDHDSKVLVTLEIQGDKKLYQNAVCYINRDQLVMGDTSLAFIPDPHKPGAGKLIEPGATLIGQIPDDPTGLKTALQGPIKTVTETGQSLQQAADALTSTARRVDDLLNTEQSHIRDVLANAAVSMKAISEILGDHETRVRLAEAMQKLPETLDNMNQSFTIANKSLEQFAKPGPDGKNTMDRMNSTVTMTEGMLKQLTTAPPGELSPVQQIAKAMNDVSDITRIMKTVVDRLENGEGTIGALMTDRQLYDRLNCAARNIDEVTRKLRPIVDDARVISDKVARHPGVIIRDAIKPGVGLK